LGIPSRCALVNKIWEKFIQAQQFILQLYSCHWLLIILRHVSTHLPSHPQPLLNLRLFTLKYYMIARLRSHRLSVTVLIKLTKGIPKKLKPDKDKTVFSCKVLVVVCLVIVFMSYYFRVWESIGVLFMKRCKLHFVTDLNSELISLTLFWGMWSLLCWKVQLVGVRAVFLSLASCNVRYVMSHVGLGFCVVALWWRVLVNNVYLVCFDFMTIDVLMFSGFWGVADSLLLLLQLLDCYAVVNRDQVRWVSGWKVTFQYVLKRGHIEWLKGNVSICPEEWT
jgi:hypothetical protein